MLLIYFLSFMFVGNSPVPQSTNPFKTGLVWKNSLRCKWQKVTKKCKSVWCVKKYCKQNKICVFVKQLGVFNEKHYNSYIYSNQVSTCFTNYY